MKTVLNLFSKSARDPDTPENQTQEPLEKQENDILKTPPKKSKRKNISSRKRENKAKKNLTIEPIVSKLEQFILYESYSHMFLVGCDKYDTQYKVLKFDRWVNRPHNLLDILVEDTSTYTKGEIFDMLNMIHEGNKQVGGLRTVAKGFGLVGFVKFLDCYYINLITQRRKVGKIGGNDVYAVSGTEIFPIRRPDSDQLNILSKVKQRLNQTAIDIAEARYLSLFQFIDLTKDFYFSYTYDMTNSLQYNMSVDTAKTFPPPPIKNMYAWNYFQIQELESSVDHLNSYFWVLPIIHGSFVQKKVASFGRTINITLVARRSRHFAGTRYLKRGVSDDGKVANDVESEQVVHDEGIGEGTFASFLQMRGSIPIAWTQETLVTNPKPPIVLNRVDPTYAATQAHFADVVARYSAPVLVLDLVKQKEKREREVIVGREYRKAIDHVNSSMDEEQKIRYCGLDFSHISKETSKSKEPKERINILKTLEEVAAWALPQTGLFCSTQPKGIFYESANADDEMRTSDVGMTATVTRLSIPTLSRNITQESATSQDPSSASLQHKPTIPCRQSGVLRTNCIDCLDRTNVAQFSMGVYALGHQLCMLGVTNNPLLDSSSEVLGVLMGLYTEVGDHISIQYGGSEAHKKDAIAGKRKQVTSMIKHKELLTSIRRYYSNAFTDRAKQDAMNLFLGFFSPNIYETPLWELDNDYYLHNHQVQRSSLQTMRAYHRSGLYSSLYCYESLSEDEDDNEDEMVSAISGSYTPSDEERVNTTERINSMEQALDQSYISSSDDPLTAESGDTTEEETKERNNSNDSLATKMSILSSSKSSPRQQHTLEGYGGQLPSLSLESSRRSSITWHSPEESSPSKMVRRKSLRLKSSESRLGGGYCEFSQQLPPAFPNNSAAAGGIVRQKVQAVKEGLSFKRNSFRPRSKSMDQCMDDNGLVEFDRAGWADAVLAKRAAKSRNGSSSSTQLASHQTTPNIMGLPRISSRKKIPASIHRARRERVLKLIDLYRSHLKAWWIEALESHARARMWMRLGPPKSPHLPSWFDRRHEVDRLTEFDVHFDQPYNTPHNLESTRSRIPSGSSFRRNALQLTTLNEDGTMLMDDMMVKGRADSDADSVMVQPNDLKHFTGAAQGSLENEKAVTIGKYVRELTGRARNIMRSGQNTRPSLLPIADDSLGEDDTPDPLFSPLPDGWNSSKFIGAGFEDSDADPVYTRYASCYHDSSLLMENMDEEENRKDFEEYCKDVTMASENVGEVFQQACDHHCSETLKSGRFKGLKQGVSARFVAASLAEQVDMLEHSENRELRAEGNETMHQNLTQASIHSEGLVGLIHDRMHQLDHERNIYRDMLHEDSLSSTISTLADKNAIKMYCSFFDEDNLKRSEVAHHLYLASGEQSPVNVLFAEDPVYDEDEDALMEELVQENFDQKDADCFLRRTNQFMFFNKAGAYAAAKSLLKYEKALKDYH